MIHSRAGACGPGVRLWEFRTQQLVTLFMPQFPQLCSGCDNNTYYFIELLRSSYNM